jgi:hypothetical protein
MNVGAAHAQNVFLSVNALLRHAQLLSALIVITSRCATMTMPSMLMDGDHIARVVKEDRWILRSTGSETRTLCALLAMATSHTRQRQFAMQVGVRSFMKVA